MILLFTDFGLEGPYVGQMKAVLQRAAPGIPVVDLMHDAPAFEPRPAAYLLATLAPEVPPGSVVLAVVDPGVGGARRPLVVEAEGRRYVGPDNGLLALVTRRAATPRAWEITWRPERLAASFHGRDLFAPVAARLARGEPPPGKTVDPGGMAGGDWPRSRSTGAARTRPWASRSAAPSRSPDAGVSLSIERHSPLHRRVVGRPASFNSICKLEPSRLSSIL